MPRRKTTPKKVRTHNNRFPDQIKDERLQEAYRLRLGPHWLSYDKIGERLGISHTAVREWLLKAQEQANREYLEEIKLLRETDAQRLDEIYREAMQGFERSKTDAVTTAVEVLKHKINGGGKGEGETNKTRRQTVGQNGDPQFLAVAMAALKRKHELLGVMRPTGDDPLIPGADTPLPTLIQNNQQINIYIPDNNRGPKAITHVENGHSHS